MADSARLAIYPGSFDRRTGVDTTARARLFDAVVAILLNAGKQPLFGRGARVDRQRSLPVPNVEVDTFKGLLVGAHERRASVIVRGPRQGSTPNTSWR